MHKKLVLFLTLLFAFPLYAQDVQLTIKGGDVKIVKVDQVTIVKVDRTVVTTFPFSIVAPPDEGFYDWILPAGVQGIDKGEAFDVSSAPKGDLTIRVKIRSAVLADGKIKYLTRFGTYSFSVGDVGPPTPPVPPPTPTPTPPVPPAPTPTPAPIPVAGKRVIIIYKDLGNGRTSMTAAQENQVYGAELTAYLNSHTTKVDGTSEFRIWPTNINLKNASDVWKNVMARPRTSDSWIVISDGDRNKGYEGPLPDGEGAILLLCKTWLE